MKKCSITSITNVALILTPHVSENKIRRFFDIIQNVDQKTVKDE